LPEAFERWVITYQKWQSSEMSAKHKVLLGMLIFVPISVSADWLRFSPVLVFFLAALGIVPLAALIAETTEGIAVVLGPNLGGLLNATFGNLTEMVVSIVALKAGLIEVVKGSILGAIIANLLLGCGLAMFLGGLRHKEQNFHPKIARLNASSLLLAIVVLLTPSAIHFTSDGLSAAAIQKFSYVASVFLLISYGLGIVFLKTHPVFDELSRLEGGTNRPQKHNDHSSKKLTIQIFALLICTIVLVVVSEILVGSLEHTSKALRLTELFTGIILLPLFGGVVEYITCVSTAIKNKMDLSVAVAVGSSLQMVLFVAPVLVLVSAFLGHPLDLEFNVFGMFAAVAAIFITNSISSDGQSNWMEGVLLIVLYFILGAAFYYHP
jgi:Ca2+:H+ antiporter